MVAQGLVITGDMAMVMVMVMLWAGFVSVVGGGAELSFLTSSNWMLFPPPLICLLFFEPGVGCDNYFRETKQAKHQNRDRHLCTQGSDTREVRGKSGGVVISVPGD